MTLDYHYFPWSHWSRVCSVVLHEKGLWDTTRRHLVDIRKNASFEPDYLKLNPKGVVPTVCIDGEPVCNTPVIVKTLDALVDPVVHPDDPVVDLWADRLEQVELMHLSYHVWTQGKRGEKSADILDDKVSRAERYAAGNPSLAELYLRKRDFFRQFRDEVYDAGHRQAVRERTVRLLETLEVQVDLYDHVCGDAWTWPDAIALSILWRLEDLQSGLDPWKDDPSHPVHRYFQRLKARPSFTAVYLDDPMFDRL